MKRASYHICMEFNGRSILEVVIDDHYKLKHPEMNDELILNLIRALNKISRAPTKIDQEFSYYVEEPIYYKGKPYRLILVLEVGECYLGVINAFRVKETKWDFHQKKN